MAIRGIILFALTLGLSAMLACAPKNGVGNQKDEKSEILTSLNKGDNKAALAKINKALEANSDDIELLYLKAQALSSLTGIDVYSLLPVLKIKLFDVAMTEWQSYQRYKYLTEHAALNGLDPADQGDALAAIDLMLAKLDKMKPEEITYEVKRNPNQRLEFENNCMVYTEVQSDVLQKMDTRSVFQENDGLVATYEELPVGKTCKEEQTKDPSYGNRARIHLLWNAKDQLHYRRYNLIDQKKTAAFVQGLYVLYDALPILRQIPSYKAENMAKTNEALEILQRIRLSRDKTDRLGKNSRQQITLIAGYILASVIKDSIDLYAIARPQEIICHLKPERAADHYEVAVMAGKHLFEVLQDTDFYETHQADINKENLIERAREALYDLPEQSNDEIRKKIIDYLRHLQRQHC